MSRPITRATVAVALLMAVSVGESRCTTPPLDEPTISDAALALTEAFGCTDDELAAMRSQQHPVDASALARRSDAVVTAAVTAVRVGHPISVPTAPGSPSPGAQPSQSPRATVLVDVTGTSAGDAEVTETIQLMAAAGVSAHTAAAAVRVGTHLVAFTTAGPGVTWCGVPTRVPTGAQTPIDARGLVLSTGDPTAPDELVWPMLRITSSAPLEDAMPGGDQYPD